jgi:hypothetical protein
MLSASGINAHIPEPSPGNATELQAAGERTESYDFAVEFQAEKPAELAIFVIRGCTPSAQYHRREFPA